MQQATISQWIIYGLGFLAQGFFSLRILVQWIMSEKAKKVVSPTIFWVFSIAGSYLFFVYGWLRNDFAIMFGQVISYYIYIWNLKVKGAWDVIRTDKNDSGDESAVAAKGIKVPAPQYWRLALLAILVITPVIGVGYILSDWQTFKTQCFHNESIPSMLVIYGSLGQIVFTLRFIYQFVYSKRRHDRRLPAGFWIISLAGSAIIVSYAFIRHDPVLALGQSIGFISYSRNLIILHKAVKKEQEESANSAE